VRVACAGGRSSELLACEQGGRSRPRTTPRFAAAPFDLEGRSRIVAAGNDELCVRLATALTR